MEMNIENTRSLCSRHSGFEMPGNLSHAQAGKAADTVFGRRASSCRLRSGIEPGPTVERRRAHKSGHLPSKLCLRLDTTSSPSSSPFSAFEDYFSFEAVLRTLAAIRVHIAGRRHRRQFVWEIYSDMPHPLAGDPMEVDAFLPPRRLWRRPNRKNRKGLSSDGVWQAAIVRAAMGAKRRGMLEAEPWGRKLLALVASVQARLAADDFALDAPRVRAVPKPGTPVKHRAIVEYGRPEDRVILAQAAKYLRDAIDGEFRDESYAFRQVTPDRRPTHHLAVGKLQSYRATRAGRKLYCAECDIAGFFDAVGHDVLLGALARLEQRLVAKGKPPLDPTAWRVLRAYLASFHFAEGGMVVPSIRQAYLDAGAGAPAAPLDGDGKTNLNRVGIPQGGALSPVLANVVLDASDKAVLDVGGTDPELFYARFCDDILIVHSDREKCALALGRYLAATRGLDLPVYPLENNVCYGAAYFDAKSKGPFAWDAEVPDGTATPWISFVGYQVRHDGEVRLRRKTMKKHFEMQTREISPLVRRLRMPERDTLKLPPLKVYNRIRGHLISQGIGRSDQRRRCPSRPQRSWLDAFPLLDATPFAMRQMRALDRHREQWLAKARRRLEEYSRVRGEPMRIMKFPPGELAPRPDGGKAFRSGKSTSYAGRLEKQLPVEIRIQNARPSAMEYGL